MSTLQSVKTSNVDLNRKIFNLKEEKSNLDKLLREQCRSNSSSLHEQHTKNLQDVQSACLKSVSEAHANCRNETMTTVSDNLNKHFSVVLQEKRKELTECQASTTKFSDLLDQCMETSKQNITKLHISHDGEKQFLRRINSEQRAELIRYINAGHVCAKEKKEVADLHKECKSERKTCITRVNSCQKDFVDHRQNTSSLAVTLATYKKLVNVWEQKDKDCQHSLDICRKNSPLCKEEIVHLRASHKNASNLHTQCLTEKNMLLSNVSTCQNNLIHKSNLGHIMSQQLLECQGHNESFYNRVQDLTFEKNQLEAELNLTNSRVTQLLNQTSTQEIDIKFLIKRVNDSNFLLQKLQNEVSKYESTNTAQLQTINELLAAERDYKARLDKHESKLTVKNNAFSKLQDRFNELQIDYWSNKKDLTECMSGKYFNLNNYTVRASNLSIVNYYKRQLSIQSQSVINCMRQTNKKYLNPQKFTLKDLDDILHITKNYIPVKNDFFSSKNNLKICNKHLDRCQKNLSKAQTSYLKHMQNNVENLMILDTIKPDPVDKNDTIANNNSTTPNSPALV